MTSLLALSLLLLGCSEQVQHDVKSEIVSDCRASVSRERPRFGSELDAEIVARFALFQEVSCMRQMTPSSCV
jgi:hypothetical protein